jgi:site-specific DNA-cytosine methylase
MGPAPHPAPDGRLSPEFVAWMMGLPADWNAGESRTNRLKQLGNAVVWPQAVVAIRTLTQNSR